jgi:uncharacterized protein
MEGWIMKKWFPVIGMVSLLLISGLVGCSSPEEGSETIVVNNQQEGISVTGQGKVTVVPDIAVLTLGVQSQEKTVALAQSNANDAMAKVLSALAANGIANKDIQTQRFSIQVVTNYDSSSQQSVIVGYLVTNVVTVKIRALDKVGVVIDAAAFAGGDLTRIDGIDFSVEDPTTYYNQARESAMVDAKAKAVQMASLGGVTLGQPVYISESTVFPVTSPVPIEISVAAGTSISPGEIDITTTVQIVYAISK